MKMTMYSLIVILVLAGTVDQSDAESRRRQASCQRIPRRSICSNVGYSETIFPNLLEHENLREAEESLETLLSGIASVVGTGDDCYHFLQTFLCQMHVPKCLSPGSVSLPPCREMCMMLWDRCGTTMRTIPQLSIIDCEMLRYSSGDKAIQNCTPLSDEVEDVVCCPRPFRNVGGACVKILKKARPYRSSVKSCESEGASLAKFAPTSEIHDFLEEELSGNSDMVWVGIERSNDELTWTFDGTSLEPEYLQSEGLAQLADGSTRSKKTCFALRNYEEVVTADCRTSDAPSLCQISNECPYGISSTPRGQYTPQGHEDGEGGSVPEGGEPPETKDFVPLPESGECEPQDMALCGGLHPQTRFPNSLAHENAKDAEMELRRWAPLIGIGCSPHMKELLCGLYAPPCSSVEERALLPCREVCNAAKDGCLPTMQSFNQDWPEIINCTRFPAYDGDGSCDMGSLGAPDTAVDETQSCLPLEDPICNHFYDTTTFPNAFGHTDPVEASMALNMFQSLILLDCSPDIEHFLCGMLYPFCSDAVDGPIPPCRELCESTKTGCDIYISFVGEDWPPELNCSALPWSNSTDALCMGASPNAAAGSEHTREPGTDTETDEDPDDMEGSQMNGQCEPLRIPSCMDMPYNYTQMSTRTQEEVEAEMANFAPLVQLGCSPALLQFMCAMSAPPCTVLDIPMVPCKEMCTAALEGCEDLFEQVNMTDSFPCDMLPSRDSGLCVFVEPGDKRPDGPKDDSGDCQPLEIDVCKGQGYTHTSFPNYMLHQTQAEAGQMATLFSLLVDFGECGIELLAYSCQLLAPRCLGDPMERVPPCIDRCHRVQDLCGAMLEESDFSDVLDCAILEVYGSHCEDSEIGSLPAVNETDTVESETPPSLCKPMESHMCAELGFTQTGWGLEPTTIHNDPIVMSMVSTMCSPLLLPMACSVATPYCDPQSGDVRVPCREICRDILKSCKKTIKAMGIEPPDMLSCKQYPSAGDNNCMMDIASPLKAKITDYARTETLLTLNVEQPEESFDKAGRGMSGYRVFHDTGVFEQMADGSLTEISFALSLEQSGRDIVVTVVPFNAFGEGPAADVLTTTETSVIPPHSMQLTLRPAESGVYQPHLSSNIYLLCTNTEEHVMAYPEWSRDGSVIEVEGVKYDGYKTMRYGDRSTLLEISGFDMSMFSTYTCSLEGEEKEIIVAPPCADALPSFNPMECSYFAYRLITDSMPVDVVLFGHECVDEIDDLVCSTYLASCDDPDPASCHGECRADLARCRDFSLPITPYSPCVGFPAGGFCSSGQPEPEPEPETEPEPTAGTRAEPTPEPETGPVAEPTPETETKPMAEPTPESEPEPVTMNMPEPVPTIVNESETPSAAQPPVTLKKRRYDIVNQGVRAKFQGWADVQGQGAANDYCRVLKFKKKRNYLACALAGSEDETGYTSPDIRSGDFDEGFRDTWYMKDEDGDGRDDFCRCVSSDDGSTYVSCMRAGETGFEGHYDFTPTVSVTPTDCAKIRVSPFLGHPQDSN